MPALPGQPHEPAASKLVIALRPVLVKNKCFACSRILDISFNLLRNIEGIDKLTRLKKLFLVNNKISKIENVNNLHQLQLLELGSNRIRVGAGVASAARWRWGRRWGWGR